MFIARRSLMVGVVFGVVALIGAFMRPEEFYRAYLLGFMCWLGVALGSMAILMIRHLTGGGWGLWGLVGLLGLFGMGGGRRQTTVVREDRDVRRIA